MELQEYSEKIRKSVGDTNAAISMYDKLIAEAKSKELADVLAERRYYLFDRLRQKLDALDRDFTGDTSQTPKVE